MFIHLRNITFKFNGILSSELPCTEILCADKYLLAQHLNVLSKLKVPFSDIFSADKYLLSALVS